MALDQLYVTKMTFETFFGKAFLLLLLGLFHLFVFLFYLVPEVIFISFNTWYLSFINILEMDGYNTSSFLISSAETAPWDNRIFLCLAQALLSYTGLSTP